MNMSFELRYTNLIESRFCERVKRIWKFPIADERSWELQMVGACFLARFIVHFGNYFARQKGELQQSRNDL
jgi:hypothetical protein